MLYIFSAASFQYSMSPHLSLCVKESRHWQTNLSLKGYTFLKKCKKNLTEYELYCVLYELARYLLIKSKENINNGGTRNEY